MEAASVHAFERLARELDAHAAPQELIAAARAAVLDEMRHARTAGRLARRFGANARAPEVPALGAPGREKLLNDRAAVDVHVPRALVREALEQRPRFARHELHAVARRCRSRAFGCIVARGWGDER